VFPVAIVALYAILSTGFHPIGKGLTELASEKLRKKKKISMHASPKRLRSFKPADFYHICKSQQKFPLQWTLLMPAASITPTGCA
jgi:hypothetical protein